MTLERNSCRAVLGVLILGPARLYLRSPHTLSPVSPAVVFTRLCNEPFRTAGCACRRTTSFAAPSLCHHEHRDVVLAVCSRCLKSILGRARLGLRSGFPTAFKVCTHVLRAHRLHTPTLWAYARYLGIWTRGDVACCEPSEAKVHGACLA